MTKLIKKKKREREQEMTQITSIWFEKGDIAICLTDM